VPGVAARRAKALEFGFASCTAGRQQEIENAAPSLIGQGLADRAPLLGKGAVVSTKFTFGKLLPSRAVHLQSIAGAVVLGPLKNR